MDINESLRQVLERPKHRLGDLFYGILFDQYPEMAGYFKTTNLRQQATVLMNQLQTVVAYSTHRFPAAAAYLEILGNRHHRLGIGKDFYPKWRSALLTTLEQFHREDWSEELKQQWHRAIDEAAEAMFKGYVDAVLHV